MASTAKALRSAPREEETPQPQAWFEEPQHLFAMYVIRISVVPINMWPSHCSHGFSQVGPMPDRLTVGRSRKHIVSDWIPMTAYVLRRVS